jgi:hypothetical protein
MINKKKLKQPYVKVYVNKGMEDQLKDLVYVLSDPHFRREHLNRDDDDTDIIRALIDCIPENQQRHKTVGEFEKELSTHQDIIFSHPWLVKFTLLSPYLRPSINEKKVVQLFLNCK